MPAQRWNHNIHFHRLVLAAIPAGAARALDVGCGEGMLCRAMRERVPHVVGLDVDPAGLALAKSSGGDIDYVQGDFLTHDFAAGSFDFVASIATVHHMDGTAALTRMRELLRPAGVLVVVGLARRSAADLPYDAAGFVAHRLLKLRHGYWEHPSPIADPAMTHRELRRIVRTVLPAARYRQHVLFRYSLTWQRPASG